MEKEPVSPQHQRSAYLREMEARLRHLPQSDRAEEMAEITQHFDSLIAACQAEGKTETDAVEKAIAQFGAAREIGSRLYHADKHKRFAPLIDVALFYAVFAVVFSTVIWIVGQTFWHVLEVSAYAMALRGTVPEAVAQRFIVFIGPRVGAWMPYGWPISWLVGVGAFAVLVARYGVRGAFDKARQSPLVMATLRWLLYVYLLGYLNPLHYVRLFSGAPNRPPEGVALVGTVVLVNLIPILLAGLGAFFVGRTNRRRESMADAIGCAAFVGVPIGLLQLLLQFVPTPWESVRPTPLTENLSGYLVMVSSAIAFGVVRVAIAYFGVQLGEKARPLSLPSEQSVG